jgi:hypothetical protein
MSEPGVDPSPGISSGDGMIPTEWHPAYAPMGSHSQERLFPRYTRVGAFLRAARMRRMVATRRSNSIGLVSNSSHPAANAFSRSPASA